MQPAMSVLDIMTSEVLNVIMTEMMGVAETKRRFAELIDRVLDGERFVVTRRGRPVAALVPATDAAASEPSPYLGLAAFAGAMADVPEFEAIMAEVVASRKDERQRPAPDLGFELE
jgi:prevent-host-death family protein